MGRDKYPKQSLGSLYTKIKESRVLMVGAGGIGCELLKNLVLTGFGEIHIVDLDTIDLSNLNRQFLFRNEHIKKSKALVARETASKFNPNVKIEAHHDNIKDPKFNVSWFKGFDIVFNALDNLEARRHVNRMCLAADVPLIESGTTGFNGQVQAIRKGKTECYDCVEKQVPKSFPVCTIRSTPSQPIHCIVWGKSYLFTEIFGTSEEDAPEMNYNEDADNAEEISNLQQEAKALKKIRASMGSEDFPRLVFDKVFKEDIERLRSAEGMWKDRRAPEPLDYDKLLQEALGVGSAVAKKDQIVWSVAENFTVFVDSLRRLSNRLEETKASAESETAATILSFDKDDVDTLDFVAASANLRSHVFGIEMRSKFDIKQMAGNIIPAIATTNAMTAGLCVLQAFKVMRDELQKAKMVFLVRSTERVLSSEALHRPNPECPSCSIVQSTLMVDISRATLNDFVKDFLQDQLGYDEFSISTDAGVIYDPDPDFEENLPKKLSELGVEADSFLTIIDEADENTRVNVVFSVSAQTIDEGTKPISVLEKLTIGIRPSKPAEPYSNGITHNVVANGHGKRKRAVSEMEDELVRKRGKVAEETTVAEDKNGVIILDDPSDGTILIDD